LWQGISIVSCTLLLAACGEDNKEPPELQEPQLPPEAVAVPALVQQMMDARFPADGEIHVQSKGKITITPDTPVCEMVLAVPPGDQAGYFGINSRPLFEPLGQSWGRRGGGGDRQISAAEPACHKPGSVIIYGRITDNRHGDPYKLVLAVWQDDPVKEGAVWVGGVERLKGEYPVTSLNVDGELNLTIESVSSDRDIQSLSAKFTDTLQ